MRLIAGTLKGRPLLAPKGRATRPTSDRAREAVFNVLAHAPWAPSLEGARVIDLFAGSGAFGFEALSRGAAFCLFVDTDAAARGAIRTNAESFGLIGATRIHRRDATSLGTKPAGVGGPFAHAFLDPPYGQGLAEPALAMLVGGAWLADDAAVVCEVASAEALPRVAGLIVLDEKTYGAARVGFYARDLGESRV